MDNISAIYGQYLGNVYTICRQCIDIVLEIIGKYLEIISVIFWQYLNNIWIIFGQYFENILMIYLYNIFIIFWQCIYIESPDFYANLQTGFVGRYEDKVGRFVKISCTLCFELGNTFPLTKSVLQNYK